MDHETVVYIRCPGCENAIRPLDKSPCPHCHRCPYCGRKLKPGELNCGCDTTDTVPPFLQKWIVPPERLDRERQRLVIRQQLATPRAIVMGLVIGLAMLAVTFGRHALAGVTGWLQIVRLLITFLIVLGMVQFVEWIFYWIENRRLAHGDRGAHSSRIRDADRIL